jgi:hypothetical protein
LSPVTPALTYGFFTKEHGAVHNRALKAKPEGKQRLGPGKLRPSVAPGNLPKEFIIGVTKHRPVASLYSGELKLQAVWMADVVCVLTSDPIPCGFLQTKIQGCHDSPGGVQNSYAVVAKSLYHIQRAVRASAIHDEKFKVPVRLGQNAADRLPNECF